MIHRFLFALGLAAAVASGFAPVASAQLPYENCTAAARDGAYDIPSDSPYYGPHLDRDRDGIGCES